MLKDSVELSVSAPALIFYRPALGERGRFRDHLRLVRFLNG